ncbi:MAG: UDP-N-acetylmuramoyl-tripeptide--D-alanyl-D-alanine ligase [Acidobacteria bacterium]|nr:MAG: UDP-N-acetylmuramoyl-tripeptide--D-alanyl-D-alanine ligase [Acidobacteriota bacterium]
MKLSSLEIAQAVQAISHSVRNQIVPSGYSIDSRTLRPGECFIAIRGKNFDGHQFIPEALGKGASLVIAQSDVLGEVNAAWPVIVVEDTLSALQRLAGHVRRKWGRKVVGITGSTGKTTTKEITSSFLAARFRVFKSLGNFNNDYGLPLSILKLQEEEEVAVLELGMSAAGEISRLSKIAQPDIGVVTNVNPVHLEFFQSIHRIAQAKRELVENLPSNGVAVLNNDDPHVRRFGHFFPGQVLTYGVRTAAGYRVSEIRFHGLNGSEFRLDHKGSGYLFSLPLIGLHNVYNCLPAIVVAHCLGLGFEVVDQRIKQLEPSPGRGEILHFAGGFTIVNDSYNSNPAALETMIQFLKRVPGYKRKILVGGEMLELGARSPEFHRSCGDLAAKAKLDFILGVSGQACHLVEAARARGYDADHALFFENAMGAGVWLSPKVRAGDLILIKGSRGVKTEFVIEALKQDHPLMEN